MSQLTNTIDVAAGTGSATQEIGAPPAVVYALITDLSRMAEWSPECVGVDAPSGSMVEVGSTFTGRNARDDNEWSTDCRVLSARADEEFSFFSGDDETGTTWTYTLAPTPNGVKLAESFDSLRLRHPEWVEMLAGRAEQLVDDMLVTLARVKAVAENRV